MLKKLLIFAALALLVWAIAVFWPKRAQTPKVEANFVWPDFSVEEIDDIRIQNGDRSFSLVSRQGTWYVDLPGKEIAPKADENKVLSLFDFFNLNKPIQRLDTPGEGDYGLVEPQAIITLNGDVFLKLGAYDSAGDGVFAEVKSEPGKLLMPREYVARLNRKPEYYFDMKLFGIEEENVQAVTFDSMDAGDWKIVAEDGKFIFREPAEKTGEAISIQEWDLFVHTLLTAEATGLLFTEPPGPLDKLVTINVTGKNGSESLEVLAAGESLVGRADYQPVPFKLDPELRSKLLKSAFALTDRRILALDLGKITRLTISRGDRELSAVREDSAWNRSGESEEILGIDMNLWRLTDLKYESNSAWELPATAHHALTLSLWSEQDEPVAKLDFYMDPELPGGLCWIATSGDKAYYPVSAQLYKDLAGLLPPSDAGQKEAENAE